MEAFKGDLPAECTIDAEPSTVMQLQSLRGMVDLLPQVLQRWQAVEAAAGSHFRGAGLGESRTPLREPTDL